MNVTALRQVGHPSGPFAPRDMRRAEIAGYARQIIESRKPSARWVVFGDCYRFVTIAETWRAALRTRPRCSAQRRRPTRENPTLGSQMLATLGQDCSLRCAGPRNDDWVEAHCRDGRGKDWQGTLDLCAGCFGRTRRVRHDRSRRCARIAHQHDAYSVVGIAGTMVANGSGIQRETVRNILLAWILTLPVCVLLGAALFGAALLFVFRVLGMH